VNLGAAINSSAFNAGASLWGPELYFTSNRATGDALDVYVTIRHGSTLGPATLVAELSSDGNDLRPSVRFDGQEILLSSDRAGGLDGSQDLWLSTRKHQGDPWSIPGTSPRTGPEEAGTSTSTSRRGRAGRRANSSSTLHRPLPERTISQRVETLQVRTISGTVRQADAASYWYWGPPSGSCCGLNSGEYVLAC
jgi:hypothetical protein